MRVWQTLLTVKAVFKNIENNYLFFAELPALQGMNKFSIPFSDVPKELHQYLVEGERFFVDANISDDYSYICIQNYDYRGK